MVYVVITCAVDSLSKNATIVTLPFAVAQGQQVFCNANSDGSPNGASCLISWGNSQIFCNGITSSISGHLTFALTLFRTT